MTIATDFPRMLFVYGNCPRKKINSTDFQPPQMFQVVSINSMVTLVIIAWNFRPLFQFRDKTFCVVCTWVQDHANGDFN